MNKKILSFDLDGTLLNCEHQITPRTRDVIRALKDMGHIIVINTGRSYNACNYYGKLIDADYILACNGAMIYDNSKNEMLKKIPLDKEIGREILLILYTHHTHHKDLKIQWDSGQTYYSNNITPFETSYINNYKNDYPQSSFNYKIITETSEIKKLDEEIYQIFFHAMGNDKTMYFKALEKLNKLDTVNIIDFKRGYTDINHPIASKGNGLKILTQSLNMSMEDVIVFGDGDNDISMFKCAGVSVAMKNACSELKNLANMIADHHDEEGVASALMDLFELKHSFL